MYHVSSQGIDECMRKVHYYYYYLLLLLSVCAIYWLVWQTMPYVCVHLLTHAANHAICVCHLLTHATNHAIYVCTFIDSCNRPCHVCVHLLTHAMNHAIYVCTFIDSCDKPCHMCVHLLTRATNHAVCVCIEPCRVRHPWKGTFIFSFFLRHDVSEIFQTWHGYNLCLSWDLATSLSDLGGKFKVTVSSYTVGCILFVFKFLSCLAGGCGSMLLHFSTKYSVIGWAIYVLLHGLIHTE